MLRCTVSLIVLLGLLVSLQAQTVSYLPQIGDGPLPPIELLTEFIFVNSGPAAQVNVAFKRTPDGMPMTLDLVGIGEVSEHNFVLGSGESTTFATSGEGPGVKVGYAVVTLTGLAGGGGANFSVGGTAVFVQRDIETGTIFNEAGVPLVSDLSDFSLFVDTTGTRDTAIAIVSTGTTVPFGAETTTPVARLNLFDTSFGLIATTEVPIPEGGQANRFLAGFFDPQQVPEVQDMQGSLTVTPVGGESDGRWAALTVRTNNAGGQFPGVVPTFTPFPVVPGAATQIIAGVSATAARLSTDSLQVTLDLTRHARQVKGAIVCVSSGGVLVSEAVHALKGNDIESFELSLPAAFASSDLDRIEVRLIYSGGDVGPRMQIE